MSTWAKEYPPGTPPTGEKDKGGHTKGTESNFGTLTPCRGGSDEDEGSMGSQK